MLNRIIGIHHRHSETLFLDSEPMTLRVVISAQRTAKTLTLAVLCITMTAVAVKFLAYFSGHNELLGLTRQFDLNGEANIPAWYSSVTLLICSVLLATIASVKKTNRDPYAPHWKTMAIIFLFLAVDETAQIHEMITVAARRPAFAFHLSGIFYYSWVIPYGLFALLFALAYLKFLAHLPAKIRWLFVIAAGMYVGGAMGMEMLAGFHRTLYWNKDEVHTLMTMIEECFEMMGIVVFTYALTAYMSLDLKGLQVNFTED
jgi:hypothetical protein